MDTTGTPSRWRPRRSRSAPCLPALVAYKRAHPGDDLTSELIDVRDERRAAQRRRAARHPAAAHRGRARDHRQPDRQRGPRPAHPSGPARAWSSGEVSWDDVIEETLRWTPSIADLPLRFAIEPNRDRRGPDRGGRRDPRQLPGGRARPDQHGPDADRVRPHPGTRSTWPSATACTTASARPWPAWRRWPPCPPSSPASRTSGWRSPRAISPTSHPSSPRLGQACPSTWTPDPPRRCPVWAAPIHR